MWDNNDEKQLAGEILVTVAWWRAHRKNPPPDLLAAVDRIEKAAHEVLGGL
jgi:hypothetical protein